MLNPVYILSDNVITPSGSTSDENFDQMCTNTIAIKELVHPEIGTYYASRIDDSLFDFSSIQEARYTRMERFMITSINTALSDCLIEPADHDTIFIFSSTKGNIDLLTHSSFDPSRLRLGVMANVVAQYFGNPNKPVVISNACISGMQAIAYALNILNTGSFKNAIVCGGDMLTDFVLAGFHSFQALSPFVCRPFDKNRAGLNLGEGFGTLVLSSEQQEGAIRIIEATSSNDANHLSGPSRTGDGLSLAIDKAMKQAGLQSDDIDLISAHGTATLYNDEMESLAFKTCGLERVPVNSLKGYIGHTLGAAGIIETIMTAKSIKNKCLIPSAGFAEQGTSVALNIITQKEASDMDVALKTASGFGGGNAALLLMN